MRRSSDFAAVIRGGRRVRRGCLVVHHLAAPSAAAGASPIVGLVVGRGVGPSVVRHRVSRRLRAQLAARLDQFAPSSATVIRALPEAGTADSAELARALDAAFADLRRPVSPRSGPNRVGRQSS